MITNNKVKELVMMNQKAKARREVNAFLVEGIKMFMEAPADRIREVYVSESFFEKWEYDNDLQEKTKQKLEHCGYEIVNSQTFKKISDTMTPQGILCVMERNDCTLSQIIKKEHPFLMVLEDIQDPGNMGTILRTGEGAGVDGIIMSKGCVDIYNPKTIRSTMGSIYRVPFVYSDDIFKTIETLKNNHIKIFAAHLDGKVYYDEITYQSSLNGTCFLIGNEGNGLSEKVAKSADTYVKIPMEGNVESLNAAVASSILMYEVLRQRRKG